MFSDHSDDSHVRDRVRDAHFVAIDVETANANYASVCHIATVSFVAGRVAQIWESLVDPEEPFAAFNVSVHGIDEVAVQVAPSLPVAAPNLYSLLTDKVVVSHMLFDRIALQRAFVKYSLPPVTCTWLDTARVCRRAWPRFAKKGYGLRQVASWCDIDFHHHNALEDARVAGSLLVRAVADTGIGVNGWITRARTRGI